MTGLEQPKPESSWDTCQGSAECMVIAIGGNVCERRTVANNSELPWDQEESGFLPRHPCSKSPCVGFRGLTFRKKVPLLQEPQGGGKELLLGPQLAWSLRAGFKIVGTANRRTQVKLVGFP